MYFFPSVRSLFQSVLLLNLGSTEGQIDYFRQRKLLILLQNNRFKAKSSHQYNYSRPYFYFHLRIFPPVHLFQSLEYTFINTFTFIRTTRGKHKCKHFPRDLCTARRHTTTVVVSFGFSVDAIEHSLLVFHWSFCTTGWGLSSGTVNRGYSEAVFETMTKTFLFLLKFIIFQVGKHIFA